MGVRGGIVALAGLLLTGCGGSVSSEGACAGPLVTVSPATVAAGEEVRVQSGGLLSDCYDTGHGGTPPPAQDVSVVLLPPGQASPVPLAEVDADAGGRIDVTVQIPAGTAAGAASIQIWGSSADLEVTPPA